MGGKENHSKSLFRRHGYLSAQFFMRITNFLYSFSRLSERFLISALLAILRISIQNKELRPKIIKHTFKQLKRIWSKLTLNIKINKRKLISKQQKDAAIYITSILIIIQTCDERGDIKADLVRVGFQGAVSWF